MDKFGTGERFQRDLFGFVMLARRSSMEMKRVALECERRAAEFRELAESGSPSDRTFCLELEQHWLHLACVYYQANAAVQALRSLDKDEELEDLNSSGRSIHQTHAREGSGAKNTPSAMQCLTSQAVRLRHCP